jgi:hypothetical protein
VNSASQSIPAGYDLSQGRALHGTPPEISFGIEMLGFLVIGLVFLPDFTAA